MKRLISLILISILLFCTLSVNAFALEEALELGTDTVVISPNQMVYVQLACTKFDGETVKCKSEDETIVKANCKDVDYFTTDLYIYGYEIGKTKIKVTLLNKNKGVIVEKYIMVDCVKAKVTTEDVVINIDEETSKTVLLEFTGGVPQALGLRVEGYEGSIISCQAGNSGDHSQELIVTALKEGSTSLFVEFYDYNTKQVFAKKEIAVTVHKHTLVTKTPKKATYFAKGYSGDLVCSECQAVVKKGKETAKLTLKAPKISLTSGKKQFKVKYTKVADATGFQVRYKIKGSWKTKDFDTKKTATKVVKNLKKGKYTVQARAFKKQNGKKAFSKWSTAQSVKVK